jgi:serine phosphatase RsbU (regulator of sigma subunit)
MAMGDSLVLVTDGFFECRNTAGDMLGADRLADAIRQHQSNGAAEMIRRLYGDVVKFSAGTKQGDDITAVVIKRASESAEN